LIFDSIFDKYRGVVAYVRLVDGTVTRGDKVRLLSTDITNEVEEVGSLRLGMIPRERLEAG
jgi:GTP-binding protein LepA